MGDLSTNKPELLPVVGITGGIGSGKSLVSQVFRSLNIPTFNADSAARSLYHEDLALRQWVVEEFGADCANWENGELVSINRTELAQIVFHDAEALKLLNAQIHPRVSAAFGSWHQLHSAYLSIPFVMREAAILFESGSHQDCHAVISIEAPVALRAKRAADRLGATIEEIQNRMAAQWTDEQRRKRADYILHNSSDDAVVNQAIQLLNDISTSIGKGVPIDS